MKPTNQLVNGRVFMKHFSELTPAAERIVNVAESLVRQVGYNGFSFEDVARQVGIKKPSVHHHFATKVELVAVMTQRYTHRFREQLLRIEGQFSSPIDQVRAYADLFVATFAQGRDVCVCGMLGAESESLPESLRSEVANFFKVNLEWLEKVIKDAQAKGQVGSLMPASAMASLMLSALEGAMMVGRGLTESEGPAGVASALIDGWRLPAQVSGG